MTKEKLMDETMENKIGSLLKAKKFAVLSTAKDGNPYSNLVAFVEDTDLRTIFFATERNTQKFINIKKNNSITLLVENSMNDAIDIKEAMVATILGKAEILKESEKKRLTDQYVKKHPYLTDFVASPGCAIIKLKVEKYILVENFQQKTTIRVDSL